MSGRIRATLTIIIPVHTIITATIVTIVTVQQKAIYIQLIHSCCIVIEGQK